MSNNFYSPKKATVVSIDDGDWSCSIKCSLRLKWKLENMTEDKVTISHRNITMTIDKDSFESGWRRLTTTGGFTIKEQVEEIYRNNNGQIDQKEIAGILGISPSTVRKYLPVGGKELDVDMLVNLADSGWTLKELRTEAEYQTKRSYSNDEIIKILAEREYGLADG